VLSQTTDRFGQYPAADKLIGGLFGLQSTVVTETSGAVRFLDSQNIFFANATSALAVLIKHLRPGRVWLPSYMCVALRIAVQHAGAAASFYPIDRELAVQSLAWLDEVGPGDAVVMIDYYGSLISAEHVNMIRERGAVVIEDATQALLSKDAGSRGDFAVFSPRKFLGVPDGGILFINRPLNREEFILSASPENWWLDALNATILRRQFDTHGGSRDWFALFQRAEANAPVGEFRMSDLSRILLDRCFDYPAIAKQRCENYDKLYTHLADIALLPSRSSSVVPLAFPIRIQNRDRLRHILFQHQIYPPIHWPLEDIVPERFSDSHKLSSEIMSLPCDQRYDERDMERMIGIIRQGMA
jgi:dTDP-4-amino-4,6-dideoxygalactose transaminase